MDDPPVVPRLVDDLFRRSHGEIVAVLLGRLGGARLDVVEEAVQEAFLSALRAWPYRGVPDNPRGWLYRVATRRALDMLTRGARREELLRVEAETSGPAGHGLGHPPDVGERGDHGGGSLGGPRPGPSPELPDPDRVADDELALLLLCCDPALSRVSRLVLTLKVGCGFSVREIGAALLSPPATVAQRLVRAKRTLRGRGLDPPEPTIELLRGRAPVLREAIYLMFSAGHTALEGEVLVREDLCLEAIRLARLMLAHGGGNEPATHALAALMCLHAARLPARTDEAGALVHLDEQDRSLWHPRLLAEGFHHLERAASGTVETRYHLEAAIASVHAAASSAAETDWPRLVDLYDKLMARFPSPVVALNRAVAVGRARGPDPGLEAIREAAGDPALASYHLRAAVTGDLLEAKGDRAGAAAAFTEALALCASAPERAYLRRRLERLDPRP